MTLVYVLNCDGQPLMPTTRYGHVRRLLNSNRARVIQNRPFTIQLTYDTTHFIEDLTLGIDAGSRTVGASVTSNDKEYYASETTLRNDISKLLLSRAQSRQTRRSRKTRYRKARFNNRKSTKPEGWLAPSIVHKVQTHLNIVDRITKILPIKHIIVEVAGFDTQKMRNPEISGVEYQQGTLLGYHVREYLFEKFNRTCVYCGIKDIPLEIEHVIPRSRGGSDRVDNLAIACHHCNNDKNTATAEEYGFPRVQARVKQSLVISTCCSHEPHSLVIL